MTSLHTRRTLILCFFAAALEGADIVSMGLAAPSSLTPPAAPACLRILPASSHSAVLCRGTPSIALPAPAHSSPTICARWRVMCSTRRHSVLEHFSNDIASYPPDAHSVFLRRCARRRRYRLDGACRADGGAGNGILGRTAVLCPDRSDRWADDRSIGRESCRERG